MSRNDVPKIDGMEISPEERTPLVGRLLDIIANLEAANARLEQTVDELKDEIRRLKGVPEKLERKRSSLEQPAPPGKKQRRRGKRPGSAKRMKTRELVIDETIPLEPEQLPDGAVFHDYRNFTVQDLVVRRHVVRYRRARYLSDTGKLIAAPLPDEIRRHGHFGPGLRAYVLCQYYQNHVTQPLIAEDLRDRGLDISVGEIHAMLTEGHETFHAEKDALLPAAREVSNVFHTDDTTARHQGKNAHTHQIGNNLFTSFTTTQTKSRLNFLNILRVPFTDYVLREESLWCLEYHEISDRVVARLTAALGDQEALVFPDEAAWTKQLSEWRVSKSAVKAVTEAALIGCLIHRNLYPNATLISDDAGQFQVLGFMHGLCWIHAVRHIDELVPETESQRRCHKCNLTAIWKYYRRLKAYRESPTPQAKARLGRDFDKIFGTKTGWPELNTIMQRILAKRETLLLVLDHPEIPLNNNLSEQDIREYAKKRKISAGTRNDLGRRCRDTFLSLKKTCRKLGVSFSLFIQDRINRLRQILPLPEIIRQKAQSCAQPS
jgi:hypothetical protein